MTTYEHKEYALGFVVDASVKDSPWWQHVHDGKHSGHTGRRYRRGKNRCLWCGALNDAPKVAIVVRAIFSPTENQAHKSREDKPV